MGHVRDYSIDIIKFIAVLLIFNSHADICYPKYSVLATGGAIGDCLFLFCSGYTLFFGRMNRFDNYIKRRINRIYPSAFATIIVMLSLQQSFDNLVGVIKLGAGRDFLNAIMIYYVILWFVRRYASNQIPWLLVLDIMITLVAYWFFPYKYETGCKGIYGFTSIFRWIPYFGIMLMGAYLGIRKQKIKFSIRRDSINLILCLGGFYGIQFIAKKYHEIAPLQIITVVFLGGIIYFIWKICNAQIFIHLYRKRHFNFIILAIGGLCLETYLIQFSILTNKLNWLFPLNIPIIFVAVLIVAYFVRCLARLICQTFRTEDYEWKAIFKII